jgi:hypothetical protein
MLTLKRRRKRRFPPQRGRGAILGLFFCCAQCSISAAVVSIGPALATARSFAHACLPHCASHLVGSRTSQVPASGILDPAKDPAGGACTRQTRSLAARSAGVLCWYCDNEAQWHCFALQIGRGCGFKATIRGRLPQQSLTSLQQFGGHGRSGPLPPLSGSIIVKVRVSLSDESRSHPASTLRATAMFQ